MKPPHLTSAVEFVSEFDFTEGDRSFHPVRAEVWRVWMDVDAAGSLGLRFASGDPLPVHVLPPVVVRRHKVQQERIHGVRVQSGRAHFQNREHAPSEKQQTDMTAAQGALRARAFGPGRCSPAILCDDHLVCELLELLPQGALLQGHPQLPLRGVALLAAGLQLALHRAEEVVHPVLDGLAGALPRACRHPAQLNFHFLLL